MLKDVIAEIRLYLEKLQNSVDTQQVNKFLDLLLSSNKIFVVGAGRSGLVGRAFAMRLAHLAFRVYVVGETVTPAVEKGDLVIGITGSGETPSTVNAIKIARDVGARIVVITSRDNSTVAKLADVVIKIAGKTKVGKEKTLLPLGSIFEIMTLVFLDSLVVELMKKLNKTEEDLKAYHAVLE